MGARLILGRIGLFAGTVLVILLAATGVAYLVGFKLSNVSGHSQTYSLSGTFDVNGNCGQGGYSDLTEGANVTVKDDTGRIIGNSAIKRPNLSCHFTFSVARLPKASFYSVEISHRGALTFSFDDLQRKGWQVALSVGS